MTEPPDLIADLQWRGLIADATDLDRLRARLNDGPIVYYCGFDPTAESLHVGSLVQIMTMRRLQDAGHRPLALVGGATGLIGDPKESGQRNLNEEAVVQNWVDRIEGQLRHFLEFDESSPNAARMVNNYDWTKNLSAIDLLRGVGKHFSVNRMLDREAVKVRLEGNGISYTEFSYQLLQSYDYVQLNSELGCELQSGGADQWGNITAGVNLVRRMNGELVHAFTTPLLEKSDGTKFGKTESGTVWLSATLTSPYAFYQFWLNGDDRDVANWLKVFSLKPRAEIEAIVAESQDRPGARIAQRALAEELSTLVHGKQACAAVIDAARALFGQEDLRAQDPETLSAALTEAGVVDIETGEEEVQIVDVLAGWDVVGSKGAARRMIKEGGAYLNNERITDADQSVTRSDLIHDRWLVVRRGKKKMAGVRISWLFSR